MIFGEFAGGGKYSFIDDRGVVANRRRLSPLVRCAYAHPTVGLKLKMLTSSMRAYFAVRVVAASAMARGRADAYICGQAVKS